MGKGYNNYMCKKPFHPGSKANIKRTWMAERKNETDLRKQEELRLQYEKEQDLYNNKAMVSKDSKEKLQLNFMYEPPPGAKKEREKEDNEPEYKFEWQRKYNAPREDFAKNDTEIRDQPFGIPVRNVRCIKCHKWGHINTDKECALYRDTISASLQAGASMDPTELMRRMKAEEGLAIKQAALGYRIDLTQVQQLMEQPPPPKDTNILETLTSKEKKALLKKLEKERKKERKQKKKQKKKRARSSSSSSDSSSSSEDSRRSDDRRRRKEKERKHREESNARRQRQDRSNSGEREVSGRRRRHDSPERDSRRHNSPDRRDRDRDRSRWREERRY